MKGRKDRSASVVSTLLFSVSLGIGMLAVPLLSIDAGYSASFIGLLVGVSALAQMVVRLGIGALMRRCTDRALLVSSALVLTAAYGLVAVSATPALLMTAMVLEGVARALYWTCGQTHMVRMTPSASRPIAAFTVTASVGLTVGPLLGGFLAGYDGRVTLIGAAVASVCTVPLTLQLARLPPFPVRVTNGGTRLWNRRGVNVACWASASSGAWRGVLTAYVPVVLAEAGRSSESIGTLMSITNTCTIVGAWAVAFLSRRREALGFIVSTVAAAGGLALVALSGQHLVVATVALVVAGIGGGAIQTLPPVLAVERTREEEVGDVIALIGVFRSGATFVAPMAMAALVVVVPLSAVFVGLGLLLASPSIAATQLRPDADP